MDISLVVFWNLVVYERIKWIVSGPLITGCGDLERHPITRQKLSLEGDVSSRDFTGGNLRGRISLFNGPIDRSHKIPPVIGRSFECTRATHPRPMGIAMGRCCWNELTLPANNLLSCGP